MEREKIYTQLGLSMDAGLFIRRIEGDAFAKYFDLHFLHESGGVDSLELSYFRLVAKNCRDVSMEIEGELEPDTRAGHLWGTHDVIDIKLGAAAYREELVVFSPGFYLTLKYESLIIELVK